MLRLKWLRSVKIAETKLGNKFKNKSLWFSQQKKIKVGNTAIYECFLFEAVKNTLPSLWYLIFILCVGKLRNSCEGSPWDAFTKNSRIPADWDSYTLLLQRCRALQLKASGAGDTLHLCTENYFVTSSSKRVKEGQWGEAAMYQATNPKNTQHPHLPFSCWNKKINKLGGWIQSFFQLKMENTKSTWNSATETDSCTQGKRKGQWRSHEATSPSRNHPTLLDWHSPDHCPLSSCSSEPSSPQMPDFVHQSQHPHAEETCHPLVEHTDILEWPRSGMDQRVYSPEGQGCPLLKPLPQCCHPRYLTAFLARKQRLSCGRAPPQCILLPSLPRTNRGYVPWPGTEPETALSAQRLKPPNSCKWKLISLISHRKKN